MSGKIVLFRYLIKLHPELTELDNEDKLISLSKIMRRFLSDLFSSELTNEEIEAVTIPYQN
jgi:hypothetical protein